jgi:hypothetical protein
MATFAPRLRRAINAVVRVDIALSLAVILVGVLAALR